MRDPAFDHGFESHQTDVLAARTRGVVHRLHSQLSTRRSQEQGQLISKWFVNHHKSVNPLTKVRDLPRASKGVPPLELVAVLFRVRGATQRRFGARLPGRDGP